MERGVLKDIGLTDSESRVYLALLELGSTTKGPIVGKTGVASSKIYELLDKLRDKGLVSHVIKSGTKYFEVTSPKRLIDYMREKEEEIIQQKKKLAALIPELELKRSMAGIGAETEVFKGMKGARTGFEDVLGELKKGEECYFVGFSKSSSHFESFLMNFHKKRAKKGIRCKILVSGSVKDIGKRFLHNKLTKVRNVRAGLLGPFEFVIYKDKTLILVGLEEIFIQIKSKNLSDKLRNYADYMWKLGKEVKSGN